MAYSALITDERTLSRLEEDFFRMVTEKRPITELVTQKQRIDEANLKLSQDTSNVALVGSPDAVIAASGIERWHVFTSISIYKSTFALDRLNNPTLAKESADLYLSDKVAKPLKNLQSNFIEQGRRDLGAL